MNEHVQRFKAPHRSEEWRDQAACLSHPQLWWDDSTKKAIKICIRECVVRRPCGLTARAGNVQSGVMAGFCLTDKTGRAELEEWLAADVGLGVRR